MFLNVFRRFLFIYFVWLHLHCWLTWTESIVNTPFSTTITPYASHRPFCRLNGQWYFIVFHVCEIMMPNCVSLMVEILLLYNVGKKKERWFWSRCYHEIYHETHYVLRNQVSLLQEARLAPLQNLCKSTRASDRPLFHVLTLFTYLQWNREDHSDNYNYHHRCAR